MSRYFLRRCLALPPLVVLLSLAAFGLVRCAPGGPFDRERQVPPEIERQLRARYHLDKPVSRQYGRYLAGLLRGDLGPSMRYRNHSVNELIAAGLPVSAWVGGLAFLFALGVGIPLGVWSAARRGGLADVVGQGVALAAIGVPIIIW